ncbi:MAG: hypothetical protein ACR2O1_00980, partial [Boseongicola sp.]
RAAEHHQCLHLAILATRGLLAQSALQHEVDSVDLGSTRPFAADASYVNEPTSALGSKRSFAAERHLSVD